MLLFAGTATAQSDYKIDHGEEDGNLDEWTSNQYFNTDATDTAKTGSDYSIKVVMGGNDGVQEIRRNITQFHTEKDTVKFWYKDVSNSLVSEAFLFRDSSGTRIFDLTNGDIGAQGGHLLQAANIGTGEWAIVTGNIDWANEQVTWDANGTIMGTTQFENPSAPISNYRIVINDNNNDQGVVIDSLSSSSSSSFSNLQPADGSTYGLDENVNFSVDASYSGDPNSNAGELELINNGTVVKNWSIPSDGTSRNYNFENSFSNEGAPDYRFSILDSNNDPVDSTTSRNLNIVADAPEFSLVDPTDQRTFVEPSSTQNINFTWGGTASQDQSTVFTLVVEKPDGTTDRPVSLPYSQGTTFERTDSLSFSGYGNYTWYMEAVGEDTGSQYQSSTRNFEIKDESANIKLLSPTSSGGVEFASDPVDQDSSNISDYRSYSFQDNTAGTLDWKTYSTTEEVLRSRVNSEQGSNILTEPVYIPDQSSTWLNVTWSFRGYHEQAGGNTLYGDLRLKGSNSDINNTVVDTGNSCFVDQGIECTLVQRSTQVEFTRINDTHVEIDSSDGATGTKTRKLEVGEPLRFEVIGTFNDNSLLSSEVTTNIHSWTSNFVRDSSDAGSIGNAYLESLPFYAEIDAETKNDQDVTVEFIANGQVQGTTTLSGDGVTRQVQEDVLFSSTFYGIDSRVQVLGSDGSSLASTSSETVDVVQRPVFNLVKPEHDGRIELDSRENKKDTTEYRGEIEVGEAGEITIQVRDVNGTYQNVTTEIFTRSDVGNTFDVIGSEELTNITLEPKNDENVDISNEYEWRLFYGGDDSGKTFGSSTNVYNYVSTSQGAVEIPFIFFKNINDRIKDVAGATGQYFLATMVILVVSGGFHAVARIPMITVGSMTLLTLGFSLAEGYYPIGVFWILIAVTGVAGAYFGSKIFGGS